jgi:hypothetical protein
MLQAWAGCRRSIARLAASVTAVTVTLSAALLVTSNASAGTRPARQPDAPPAATAGVSSVLAGVAVAPGGMAWAVGSWFKGTVQGNMVERWRGGAWRLQPSPDVGSPAAQDSFSGVAATSATSAWAVGISSAGPVVQTVIERWNGSTWHRVPSPTPPGSASAGFLDGVAALSRSSAWAVGSYDTHCLAARWNGFSWKRVPVPSPAGAVGCTLDKVAVLSPSSAWAVGDYYTGKADLTLIEHWNGKVWKPAASPSPGGRSRFNVLAGIAATSPSNAWAVGYYQTADSFQPLILHWNGKSWRRIASPGLGGAYTQTFLRAVAARSANNAWAVGAFGNATSSQTVILHWNGTAWKRVASPNPAGLAQVNALYGVAATRSGTWAVGYDTTSSDRTLILHWTGKAWRTAASANH